MLHPGETRSYRSGHVTAAGAAARMLLLGPVVSAVMVLNTLSFPERRRAPLIAVAAVLPIVLFAGMSVAVWYLRRVPRAEAEHLRAVYEQVHVERDPEYIERRIQELLAEGDDDEAIRRRHARGRDSGEDRDPDLGR
jgi:hypothetical protein